MMTVKLNNGLEVLAKPYHGKPSAVTYSNRTQAQRKAEELGAEWEVYRPGRIFYVGKNERASEALEAATHESC